MKKPKRKTGEGYEKFHISLPADILEAVEAYADRERRNRSSAIAKLLENSLRECGYITGDEPFPKHCPASGCGAKNGLTA